MNMSGRTLGALALTLCLNGCDETPTAPSSEAIVTFRVVSETFRVLLTSPDQLAAAQAAQAGGRARIPVGRIVSGTQVNTGWSWHLEDVTFAEVTIEVCDGLPSHVEREGTQFAAGSYCPWSAVIIRIERSPAQGVRRFAGGVAARELCRRKSEVQPRCAAG
jgi:hypothetical protein